MEKRITTVIFDFGGVLGLPQDPPMVTSMAAFCRLPVGEFTRLCWLRRLEYDRGTLDSAGYWGEILAAGGVEPTPAAVAEVATRDSVSWTHVNERTLAWSRELRAAGLRTAILSNMPDATLQFIRAQESLRWVEEFAVAVFSCEHREIKPDPALYRICLDRLGASPGECVFIDDSPANAEGARKLGISAVQYVTSGQVADAAAALGLPVNSLRA